MKFSPLLSRILETKGVTAIELSRVIGVSQPHLNNVLNNKRNPLSPEQIGKAANYLGVDPIPLLEAAALDRGVVQISGKPERTQRLLAHLAHRRISKQLEAQISELLNDEQPKAA